MLICLLGIAVGILLLLYIDWHEQSVLYRQFLTYLRRANPTLYWLCYRIAASAWCIFHFIHLASIIMTIFGVQVTKMCLIIPQMVVLALHIGVYVLMSFSITLLSITGAKFMWMSLTIVIFFAVFTTSNLILMVLYHRFLDEKNKALKNLLGNTRTVHFKETN
ncbi:unnamed protein product [Auanema sp. JU1783]|nr:unnamed protein product [Auanema sp. JU1783]